MRFKKKYYSTQSISGRYKVGNYLKRNIILTYYYLYTTILLVLDIIYIVYSTYIETYMYTSTYCMIRTVAYVYVIISIVNYQTN